jgi:hypothetical protein
MVHPSGSSEFAASEHAIMPPHFRFISTHAHAALFVWDGEPRMKDTVRVNE